MYNWKKLVGRVAAWTLALGALLTALPSHAEATPATPCAAKVKSASGALVQKYAYVYKGGQLVSKAIYQANGALSSVTQYVYDDAGRLWGEAVDSNADGRAERNIYYSYDKSGRLSAVGIDDGPDMQFNWVAYYSYSGNVRSAKIDENGDGVFDRVESAMSVYDAQGRLVQERNYSTGRVVLHAYDAAGNLVRDEVVDNGVTTQVVDYVYSCSPGSDAASGPIAQELN